MFIRLATDQNYLWSGALDHSIKSPPPLGQCYHVKRIIYQSLSLNFDRENYALIEMSIWLLRSNKTPLFGVSLTPSWPAFLNLSRQDEKDRYETKQDTSCTWSRLECPQGTRARVNLKTALDWTVYLISKILAYRVLPTCFSSTHLASDRVLELFAPISRDWLARSVSILKKILRRD